jgi:uncharacterized membrane protein YdbT with pleckstrin-like domain
MYETYERHGLKIPLELTLMEGENPIYYGRMCWQSNWLRFLLSAFSFTFGIFFFYISETAVPVKLLSVYGTILFLLGILFLVIAILSIYFTEYLITNYRVYIKYGLIGRKVSELKNGWITNFMVRQGIAARFLDYGDVTFSTPGIYTGAARMSGVMNPMGVKAIGDKVIQNFSEMQEIKNKIRKLDEEYEFGRLNRERYGILWKKYHNELKKY